MDPAIAQDLPHPLLQGPLQALAPAQLHSLGPDALVTEAARLMSSRQLAFVPVLDAEGRALGVVTETRLLATLQPSAPGAPPATLAALMQPPLCLPQDSSAAHGCQLCLAEGRPVLLTDASGRVTAAVGESDFRVRLQLALLAGRHRVAAVMTRVLQPLAAHDSVQQALDQMRHTADTAVVVIDGTQPCGVLTARDATRLLALHADPAALRLADVMSHPVHTLAVDATLPQAAERMLQAGTRHLVVVDTHGAVVGVLDEHTLTRTLAHGLLDADAEQERVRQRAVINAIPDLVWLKDPQGVYVSCNPRFEQLYGASESAICGRTDYDFVSPELADFFRAHDRRATERDAPSVNEEELTFADGHQELLQTIKTPVRDASGRLLGVLGIGRDITELRRVEDEYRWLFARNPAPMLVYERSTLRLLNINDAFCQLYGYSDSQARELLLTDLYLPEDRAAVRAKVATMQGLVNVGEWRHLRRDGSLLHIVAQSHDIRHDGRDCRVAVITDVSQIRRGQQRDGRRLALMERLARGDSQESLLDQLARDHEALFPDSMCSVLLLDETGTLLQRGAGPSLPEFYQQAIHGLAIGPNAGSCGAACHSGQRVLVADVQTHPNWVPYRALAAQAGLRACWSLPVIGAQGRVLGSFAVYRREPALPSDEELDQMQFGVQLAATALTHGATARALRSSEQRMRNILQAIPDMVWLKDVHGRYLACNAAFERKLNRPEAEVVGHTDGELMDEATAARWVVAHAQALAARAPVINERWLTLRRDGHRGLFEVIETPLFDASGQPTGVLGVARDITLARQGARALSEQERLIDTMFGQTTDAIVLLDPLTLRFVTFNEAAWRGLGYTREAFAQLRPQDLQADLTGDQIETMARRVVAGEEQRFDTLHRRADGGVQAAEITLRMVAFAGRTLLSAVWRDVTEARQREARIHRLNQSYAVLGAVNEAVVRLRDRAALFEALCRIVVESGGFSLAWIGRCQADTGAVQLVARAGHGASALASLPIVLDADADADEPLSRALRSGTPQIVRDLLHTDERSAWRAPLLGLGHRSLGLFPLGAAGDTAERHVLLVGSTATDHFDDEQVTLFKRLVQDLDFALAFIAAERARGEAQRFREQLVESVAGLFFAINTDGRIVLWNRRLEEVTGYGPAEVRERGAADFFDGPQRQHVNDGIQRAFATGEAQLEAELQRRDGSCTPYLFVARRLETAGGILIVGTGIDIADRVRSERELARYRDQLEDLVRQRTAELETVNARLHREDRRLRAMLALSQRASSLGVDELARQGLAEILRLTDGAMGCVRAVEPGQTEPQVVAFAGVEQPPPPDFPRHVVAQRQVTIAEGEQARSLSACDAGLQRVMGAPVLDGEHAVMVVCTGNKATPYDEADARELQLLATDLWEIVQRRRIEIALGQAKAAADAANQAKSAFLANMSHEIRTPMNAVIGFAHLLRRDPLTPRQQDHLAKITDAGQHLLQVINDILDFSKIEAAKITLEEADFALRESLDRVLAMQRDAARAKQLPLQLTLDPQCPPVLRGDRLRLEQILLNLLSNAVKFTPQGRVDLRVLLLADTAHSVTLRFEVADTGIGMSRDQLSLVFEAFAQADASTTRRFGGTGLGLAISKRLAQLMDGRIGASSAPGQGSTFWLELPLQRASNASLPIGARADATGPGPVPGAERGAGPGSGPAAAPGSPVPAAGGSADHRLRGARILVVEDNPINQEVTATLLSALGAAVELAGSGEEALRRFAARRPDLVLMDVQMPGMDGLRATGAIRQLPGGAAVPIVAMTANAFAEDRAQCLAAGMSDYLAKPVEPQALEACLRRWLQPSPSPDAPAPAAAPDAATLLRQRLEGIDSLDTVGPLARMRGAWPLYLRTLRLFVSHHAGDAQRLADPAVSGNAQALRALAHSIGGAAATVGATEVVRQAQALQARLSAAAAAATAVEDTPPPPEPGSWQPLRQALQRCLQQVQAALADADPAPGERASGDGTAATAALNHNDWAALQAALQELQPLVAAHDTSALMLFERWRTRLEAALGPEARALGAQLRGFSFGAAQTALVRALAETAAHLPDSGSTGLPPST